MERPSTRRLTNVKIVADEKDTQLRGANVSAIRRLPVARETPQHTARNRMQARGVHQSSGQFSQPLRAHLHQIRHPSLSHTRDHSPAVALPSPIFRIASAGTAVGSPPLRLDPAIRMAVHSFRLLRSVRWAGCGAKQVACRSAFRPHQDRSGGLPGVRRRGGGFRSGGQRCACPQMQAVAWIQVTAAARVVIPA